MDQSDAVNPRVWKILGAAAILLLLVTILGITSISSGFFDPKTVGSLQERIELSDQQVMPGEEQVLWQADKPDPQSYSVKLDAAWSTGEEDVGFGLALGNEAHFIVIGISPLGYVTVQDREGQFAEKNVSEPLLPWQTWPHVATGASVNEVWVDVEDGAISSIRINREILLERRIYIPGHKLGLWFQSFGKGAEIVFEELRLFYNN